MKQRDPLVQTLLSLFVPFYIIYWSYVTGKDIETRHRQKVPSILLLLLPGVIFALCFIALFVMFFGASQSGDGSGTLAASAIGTFLVSMLAAFLSFVLSLVYYYQFGGAVEKVVGSSASRLLIFILFWFVAPAAVYIIQEKLNNVGAAPSAQAPVYTAAQPSEPADKPPGQPLA